MTTMSRSKWVGHVHYRNGETKEFLFDSPVGMKGEALNKLYEIAKLDGPRDPSIRGGMIQEQRQNAKSHIFGSRSVKEEAVVVDAGEVPVVKSKHNHRYRVVMYPTYHSATPIVQRLRADNPFNALQAVAGMRGVKSLEVLGPYVIDEQSADGYKCVMSKSPNQIPKSEMVTDGVPGQSVFQQRGAAAPAMSLVPLNNYPRRFDPVTRIIVPSGPSRKDAFVNTLVDLLKDENVIIPKKATVTKE